MGDVKIVVTADDIKKGQRSVKELRKIGMLGCERSLRTECAIARAVQRALNDPDAEWFFGAGDANGRRITAVKYQKVRDWVELHDSLKPVKPFSFLVTDSIN
jgi:hypothetical protein